jgi:diaminopimelate decarboxylase
MSPQVLEQQELDKRLADVAKNFGTPTYVYFTNQIENRLTELGETLGQWFRLSYAVKCNPNPGLLSWLRDKIDYLDVSSIGELRLAAEAGWNASCASFTGPAKRLFELEDAIESGLGELIVENVREALIADEIAASHGVLQDVLIRIGPSTVPKGFGDHMAGRPSAFGIDIEDAQTEIPKILSLPHLNIVGFHIYSGTQCLKPDAICDNYRIFLDVFRALCEAHDIVPKKLVFGSGLGIPYHAGDQPLDLREVSEGIRNDLDAFSSETRFQKTKLILELGRFLVGEAGYFLTRVVAIKQSRGQTFGMCDGGLNNHLPASGNFGMVIHRNYHMHRVGGGDKTMKYNLVGPLCTSIDRLALGVELPMLAEGDIVAIHNSGAYGPTASPVHFISHFPPAEILVNESEMRDVSRAFGAAGGVRRMRTGVSLRPNARTYAEQS